MFGRIKPQEHIDEVQTARGLHSLMIDGVCSQVMGVLNGGAFLIAFALLMGASNVVIGLLAAIGPLTQILQIPAIALVNKTRHRKALVVLSSFAGRLFWILIALLPWFFPTELQIPLFLAALFIYFGLGAISGCAFNSWMRDFIPENIMGSYFAKRMAVSIAVGAVLSLGAGAGVDLYKKYMGAETGAYTIIFLIGGAAGLLGAFFLSRIPEPKMAPASGESLLKLLAAPFHNHNFRQLLAFLGSWNFAVNLAGPFFAVYMLTRLNQSMTVILGLSVLSQLVNVAFLRLWGKLADRFSNKSVLAASGPMFILSILIWPFTTMPESYFLTFPLLVIIHILAGISTAGVTLCAGNIALKAAPKGAATAYLATNALVSGIAATVAPILAGISADWFADRELSLTLRWLSPTSDFILPAVSLRGLDFLFILSFILGLYALHRLAMVIEEGEVAEQVVLNEFYGEVRKAVKHVSNVAGMRHLTYFPYSIIRGVRMFL